LFQVIAYIKRMSPNYFHASFFINIPLRLAVKRTTFHDG